MNTVVVLDALCVGHLAEADHARFSGQTMDVSSAHGGARSLTAQRTVRAIVVRGALNR